MLLGGLKRRPTPAQAFFSVACRGYGHCRVWRYPSAAVLGSWHCRAVLLSPTIADYCTLNLQPNASSVFTNTEGGKAKGGTQGNDAALGVWGPLRVQIYGRLTPCRKGRCRLVVNMDAESWPPGLRPCMGGAEGRAPRRWGVGGGGGVEGWVVCHLN